MTAYVNDEQKKEGAYGKAVKATLAATLAAGMVPAAAAFAEEPAEATAEGNDIELLTVAPENSFKAGKVTAAEDNEGNVIADLAKVSFVADGEAHFVVPTEFTPEQGAAIDVTDSAKYKFKYYAIDADGNKTGSALAGSAVVKPGKYGVTVTDEKTKWESEVAATFTIGSTSLKDATLFEGDDVEDTEFVYTGKSLNLKLALNGEELDGAKYDVKYHAKGSSTGNTTAPSDAGDYVAVVTGKDIYAGQEVEISFTIAKLDLSKANIKLDEAFKGGDLNAPVTVASINGIKDDVEKLATAKVTAVPDTIYGGKGQGVYTVKVTAVENNANVTGTQDIKVVKTVNTDAKVLYDGKALSNIDTDYSAENPTVFDAKKLAAYTAAGELIKDAKVNMVVRENDENGEIVENANLTKPGKWYVEVSVDPASTNYEYSSAPASFRVVVKDGSVDTDSEVFVKYEGEVVKGKTLTYTGEDLFKNVSVVVKSGDKTLVEGKDYKVELLKQNDKGEFVAADSMVDAGEYRVAISSENYPFSDQANFTVNPVKATEVRIDPSMFLFGDTASAKVPYTGEAVELALQYKTVDMEGKEAWVALPAEAYELTVTKDNDKVDAIKDLGSYKVKVADNAKETNYNVSNADLSLTVTDEKIFSDVPNTEWYYEHVYNAQKAYYMTGIGNSNIFAPNLSTTRAMAAQVLARMASAYGQFEGGVSFSDVAADAWYADAVAWAASTGIVSGYPGTTEFRPESNVTRVEFCAMMQRYAKATGQGVDLAEGEADEILAKYEDGASVPAWAKDAVAWAVKNEIFGGYKVLDPMGDITRAQMAKMTTVFQPEAL